MLTELEVLALLAKVRNNGHRSSDGRSWVDVAPGGVPATWVEITRQADALEAAGLIRQHRNAGGWWARWEITHAGDYRLRPGHVGKSSANPLDVDKAIELYERMSLREVAAVMKVHHPRLRQALVDAGVPIRTGRGPARKASTS